MQKTVQTHFSPDTKARRMFFPQNDASTYAKATVDKEAIESGGFRKTLRLSAPLRSVQPDAAR